MIQLTAGLEDTAYGVDKSDELVLGKMLDDVEGDHNVLGGVRQARKCGQQIALVDAVYSEATCNGHLLRRHVDAPEPTIAGFAREVQEGSVPAAEVQHGSVPVRGKMLANKGPQGRGSRREPRNGGRRSGLLPGIDIASVQALAHQNAHADFVVKCADTPITWPDIWRES